MGDKLGRWTLLEIAGRGAAGTVWSASDSDRIVTVKIADPADKKASRSILREAEILAALDHPNFPRILEIVSKPPAFIFASPPTQTYGDLLARGQLWTHPLRQRLETLASIAAALDYLHEQHILHRDIKPAHITTATPPLLFDFGIAERPSSLDIPPDPDAGTAAYMPPPHEPVSAARDVYAFGITAYEMLFGAHPLLVAADRHITPKVLRQRAADKVTSGAWRKPSHVPLRELPPDLRAANLDELDTLFGATFGAPESRPSQLLLWIKRIAACIPDVNSTTRAPDVLPESFAPAHTAHEVAAALQTQNSESPFAWRLIALATAAIVALLVFFLPGRA